MKQVSLWELFGVFAKVGTFTIGGGYAMLPLVEQELVKYIPKEDIPDAHHWLLLHGRYVCTSRKPHCEKCEIESLCPKQTEGSKLS